MSVFSKYGAFLFKNLRKAYIKEIRHKISASITHKENFLIEYPFRIIEGAEYITVGSNFYANKFLYLAAYAKFLNKVYSPQIIIGNNVHLNFNCQITATNSIKIGNGVLTGSNVLITDHTHGTTENLAACTLEPKYRDLASAGPVEIGNNVHIGYGAVILPNVSIGDNSVVGANAVVTSSFPANSVIAGVPARKIA